MKLSLFLLPILLIVSLLSAQQKRSDKGTFIDKQSGYWDEIETALEDYHALKDKKEPKKKFVMDVEGMDLPASKDQFTFQWHNDPISQGYTGTCWSFCTTSFFESEIYRLTGKKVKLSEMFTVYWEYIEKAKRYVRERGDSEFSEGSMGNHFPVIWKKYGIVPAESYTGMLDSIPFHDHQNMYKEMMAYLKNCREINFWNEPAILDNIKAILDYYIGEPPATIQVDGKKMSPLEYYKKVLKINADDYVDILSLKEKPYYEKVEYPVPDNWWHSEEYYNVPLDEFMQIIKKAIRDGYTMVIGGDVSEAGYNSFKEVAMIPTFDIPSEYINEDARQFRFSNKTTTDDHGIHVVGYLEKDGADWYLIKDSGSGSRNGPNKGYYFYHEDYIKLKMMDFTIHKDAAKEILTKFK